MYIHKVTFEKTKDQFCKDKQQAFESEVKEPMLKEPVDQSRLLGTHIDNEY